MDYKKHHIYSLLFLIILVFSLTQFIFIFVFENYFIISSKYNKFDDFNEFNNNYIDYLFLGDSRTLNQINPRYVSNNSFNYGFNGVSYIESYFRLKNVLDSNISISNLVLEIDYTMNEKLLNFENGLYFLNEDISSEELFDIDSFNLKYLITYNFGFIGRGGNFIYLITKPHYNLTNQGFIAKTGNYIVPENYSSDYNIDEKIELIYFEKILNLVSSNDLNLILIKYPQTNETLLIQPFQSDYENMLFNLINKSNFEYDFFDYSELFLNNLSLFADTRHLNSVGADKLSKIVAFDLKNLTNN